MTAPQSGVVQLRNPSAEIPALLQAVDLRKHFPISRGLFESAPQRVRAVDGVSFSLWEGETLGVVGESGCGKSTLARLLMHLIKRDAGELLLEGIPIDSGRNSVRALRRKMQMVFQDSYSSLNPRLPAEATIAYGPKAHGVSSKQAKLTARALLDRVGLPADAFSSRYPHELSGGQKQRVNIARALALEPRILIMDEAVSALDKSVEAQVLNLLRRLKRDLSLTYIFISHDLNVVQFISDRVMVMYLGKAVEIGPVDKLYRNPKHPYTKALLASRLSTDPDERLDEAPITGDPPNPINPPSGCRFRTRCPLAEEVCSVIEPMPASSFDRNSHIASCHIEDPTSGHSLACRIPSQHSKVVRGTT